MIIVVAWALVIWLVILLAFGPDLLKTVTGRKSAEPTKLKSANSREHEPVAR
mgnify:CR=1 FL=1